jgi:hypothetical protein
MRGLSGKGGIEFLVTNQIFFYLPINKSFFQKYHIKRKNNNATDEEDFRIRIGDRRF